MKKGVHIVDTTLRDGEQTAGKVFTMDEKIKIAKYLDQNGIYQIECGIPAMGEFERECIKNIIAKTNNSIISTWNRLNIKDIEKSIECNPDIIHISVPISDIQIYENLRKDRNWIRDNIERCVYFIKENGYEVTIGFEDASRTDLNYIIELGSFIENLGVKRVRISDTVGILSLWQIRKIINELKSNCNLEIEIHSHNDFGMALCNSLEAIKSGAEFVNCTLDGIGERCGNCNLQEFLKVGRNLYKDEKINYEELIKNNINTIIG